MAPAKPAAARRKVIILQVKLLYEPPSEYERRWTLWNLHLQCGRMILEEAHSMW